MADVVVRPGWLARAGLGVRSGRPQRVAVGVVELWRESLQVIAQHSPGILTFAFLGFSLPALIGAIVSGVLAVQFYQQPGNPTNAQFTYVYYWQWGLQAGLAIIFMPLARGVIAWFALHHGSQHVYITTRNALKATIKRWPSLTFTILIYGAWVLMGAYAMMMLLRELRLDPSQVGLTRISAAPDQILRSVYVRVLQGLIPNPGSPFSEMLEYIRLALRRQGPGVGFSFAGAAATPAEVSTPAWIYGLLAVLVLTFGESFFRMRVNAVMSSGRPHLLTGLGESFVLGWRWFGRVTLHVTVLRLAQFMATALFITMPFTVAQALLVPRAYSYFSTFAVYSIASIGLTALATPVIMLFIAFVATYDARLFLRLRRDPQ